MRSRLTKTLFVFWGWLVVPWVMGSIVGAFLVNFYVGITLVVLIGIWFYDMGEVTCSRCSSYNTGTCGIQAWLVPVFWKKKSVGSVSRFRVRLHFSFDILMMVVGIGIFAFYPLVLVFFLVWLALGWLVVFGPKRYHGLLRRLKTPEQQDSRQLVSLPVVALERSETDSRSA